MQSGASKGSDEQTLSDQIVFWVRNSLWSEVIPDPYGFADAVLSTFRSQAQEFSRSELAKAQMLEVSARVHALCISDDITSQNAGYSVLLAYLQKASRYASSDPHVAEEATQLTLVRVWSRLSAVRSGKSFLTWCKVILARLVSELHAAEARIAIVDDLRHEADQQPATGWIDMQSAEHLPHLVVERNMASAAIDHWLQSTTSLTTGQKQLLIVRYVGEASPNETRESLGMSTSAYDIAIWRLKRSLAQVGELQLLLSRLRDGT